MSKVFFDISQKAINMLNTINTLFSIKKIILQLQRLN